MMSYIEVLSQLHNTLAPKTYVEIGTHQGVSLQLSKCKSVAIDPQFHLKQGVVESKPSCLFFQMPSDRFFSEYDLSTLLGGQIDLCFLDGMHLYEFLLRDFMHIEEHCKTNSVIAIHDAIPSDLLMAERVPTLGAAWAGDVWKTILLLQKYRPDLRFTCIDAEPTGLVLITNLNSSSRLLRERYFSLIEEFRDLSLQEYGLDKYRGELGMVPATSLSSREAIFSRFWL